jgi:hypothetical protein
MAGGTAVYGSVGKRIYEISLHSERGVLFCAVTNEASDILRVFYPLKQFIYCDFIV